jgi:hypothetical protein
MFQSVYDYPYLSSSANHIFDLSFGFSSTLSASYGQNGLTAVDKLKKSQVYNSMAQVLVGHDATGSIRKFDFDGDHTSTVTDQMDAVFFINFARLLTKDEIKKGSVKIQFITGGIIENHNNLHGQEVCSIEDLNGANSFFTNSPAGEYGVLYSGSTISDNTRVGLVYYQAGVAVITASIFGSTIRGTRLANTIGPYPSTDASFGQGSESGITTGNVDHMIQSGTIDDFANGLRNRLFNIEFNNTVELNSTIYFCRAHHNDFNYSANPTYTTASKLRVKEVSTDQPVSYITTVGLYSADNELLAVAKLSEPLRKDPNTELTLRVRLDY